MNVIAPAPTGPAIQRSQADAEQRIMLQDISWQDYVAIGEILYDRPALRLTYDRGNLEIMTTSSEHEKYKKRLARLVETLAEEFKLPLETAGNMTFQREDLARGLEADDCFWIEHESQVRGRLDWDPERDPPPDLALEIERTSSVLSRLSIYAALGVPEVWRFDGEVLQVLLRQPDGSYQPTAFSPTFPGIPLAEVAAFLQPSEAADYLSMVQSFRKWLRRRKPRAPASSNERGRGKGRGRTKP